MLHEREPNMAVQRLQLLGKLKENRERHKNLYEEMCKGYMVLVEEANEVFQVMLKEEFEKKPPQDVDHTKIYRQAFQHAVRPREHLSDYDETIEMLEWLQEEVVRISLNQFRSWVRDEWDWQANFVQEGQLPILSSVKYTSKFHG